jgi:hypothetical protein
MKIIGAFVLEEGMRHFLFPSALDEENGARGEG